MNLMITLVFYQEADPYKSKGTGVVYIHNSFNATIIDKLSYRSDNLEALFVNIKINSIIKTVGVIYNPPSGDNKMFLCELQQIIENCSSTDVQILGDFNFDLHKISNENDQKFEEIILTGGMFPLISLATHAKPNCNKTCIDNIFTNQPESVKISGTIEQSVSHHFSVFCFSTVKHSPTKKEAVAQHYDFSKSKTELFIADLQKTLQQECTFTSLSEFLEMYDEKIDKYFKLENPKITKRNWKVNPWITDGLINSIRKKDKLYFASKHTTSVKIVMVT